jgi:penicillin-binding protein 1A
MGNDDYTSTKRMTGGTVPAMIWHNIMAYAHQGIELRPLPGLPPPVHAPTVANATLQGAPPPQQILLTRKATEALIHAEHLLDEASHALSAQGTAETFGALDGPTHNSTQTAATELKPANRSHGN